MWGPNPHVRGIHVVSIPFAIEANVALVFAARLFKFHETIYVKVSAIELHKLKWSKGRPWAREDSEHSGSILWSFFRFLANIDPIEANVALVFAARIWLIKVSHKSVNKSCRLLVDKARCFTDVWHINLTFVYMSSSVAWPRVSSDRGRNHCKRSGRLLILLLSAWGLKSKVFFYNFTNYVWNTIKARVTE